MYFEPIETIIVLIIPGTFLYLASVSSLDTLLSTDKGVFVSGRIHQSLVGFLRYIYLHAKCWSGVHF